MFSRFSIFTIVALVLGLLSNSTRPGRRFMDSTQYGSHERNASFRTELPLTAPCSSWQITYRDEDTAPRGCKAAGNLVHCYNFPCRLYDPSGLDAVPNSIMRSMRAPRNIRDRYTDPDNLAARCMDTALNTRTLKVSSDLAGPTAINISLSTETLSPETSASSELRS